MSSDWLLLLLWHARLALLLLLLLATRPVCVWPSDMMCCWGCSCTVWLLATPTVCSELPLGQVVLLLLLFDAMPTSVEEEDGSWCRTRRSSSESMLCSSS